MSQDDKTKDVTEWDDKVHQLLDEFTVELFLLTEITGDYGKSIFDEWSEIIKKLNEWYEKEMQTSEQFEQLNLLSRKSKKSMEMQWNASFIYAFALFEKFLADLVRLSFKENDTFQKKYKEHFSCFAKKQKNNYNSDKHIDMLIHDDKMIANYDELPNPLKSVISILGIDSKKEPLQEFFFHYIEARERRNLLTHRGRRVDKRYIDSVKNGFGKRFHQSAKKFLLKKIPWDKKRALRKSDKKLEKIDDLIGLSADVYPSYFYRVIKTLIFLSCVLHMSAFKLSKSEVKEKGEFYFGRTIHEILCFAFDNEMPSFSFVNIAIWKYFDKNIRKVKLSELGYVDQVNYCLQWQYYAQHTKDHLHEDYLKEYLEKLRCEKPAPKFKIHHELAMAHFAEDVPGLLKAAESFEKDGKSRYEMAKWFIFKYWIRNSTKVLEFFKEVLLLQNPPASQ